MFAFKPDAMLKSLVVPSKSAILSSLMGGLALPASELSFRAGVGLSTTSFHLTQLEEDGILRVRKIGRHRYYELNGFEVAEALERVGFVPVVSESKTRGPQSGELRKSRWCYDHLAGETGVQILLAMRKEKLIRTRSDDFELLDITKKGDVFFSSLGMDVADLGGLRRKIAYECIDWSERRPHLAGSLGASFAGILVRKGYLLDKAPDRVAKFTRAGRKWLNDTLSVD